MLNKKENTLEEQIKEGGKHKNQWVEFDANET